MRAALAGLKGVKDADVSYQKQQAAVRFADKANVSLDDVTKALKNAGYKCSAV